MIKLRELEFNDLELINKWRNNKEIINSLGGNYRFVNLETERKWFENYMNNRQTNIRLMITDNDNTVGMVNLLNHDSINQHAEFSIQIGEIDSQSRGIGTQSTKLILKHGFENMNLHKIYLTVLVKNQRAIRLYGKCGFKIEGTLREEIFKNGNFEDMFMMSILKNEYVSELLKKHICLT